MNNPEIHHPRCSWLVESCGVVLLDREHGAFGCVPYPAAAVWDFMVRGYALEKIAALLRPIAHFSDQESTRTYAESCFKTWEAAGFIECQQNTADV
jgi:hypothetical protein